MLPDVGVPIWRHSLSLWGRAMVGQWLNNFGRNTCNIQWIQGMPKCLWCSVGLGSWLCLAASLDPFVIVPCLQWHLDSQFLPVQRCISLVWRIGCFLLGCQRSHGHIFDVVSGVVLGFHLGAALCELYHCLVFKSPVQSGFRTDFVLNRDRDWSRLVLKSS